MGRNRKSLGGQWGEAVMTSMMAEYNQNHNHNKGKKKANKKNKFSFQEYVQSITQHPSNPSFPLNKEEPLYKPRTLNQEIYLRFLTDKNVKIVLGVGPAGCGKTLFACHRAIEELRAGNIKKIIITRPMVAVEDESVGFLPGDMNQKMAPWTRPIFDIFGEYYDTDDLNEMVRRNIIEISPLAYMRGRTFKDAFIIADEMQNSTPNQMLMVTTRLGQDSKMVITGDLNQSDRGLSNNGLLDLMYKLRRFSSVFEKEVDSENPETNNEETEYMNNTNKKNRPYLGIKLVQLESTDVCRSPIVSKILDIYQIANENEFVPASSSSATNKTYKPFLPNNISNSFLHNTTVQQSLFEPIPLIKSKSLPEHYVQKNVSEVRKYVPRKDREKNVTLPVITTPIPTLQKENKTEIQPRTKFVPDYNHDCALIPKKDQDRIDNQCSMH
jgi:phosphate starvation-inducible PhoH-like protein